jgi:serine protease inhibitor
MVLLLPPAGQSPDQLIDDLQTDRLKKLFDQDLAVGRILLDLPKFEIEYKIQLNEVLKAMGMEIAFDPFLADFSRLGRACRWPWNWRPVGCGSSTAPRSPSRSATAWIS